MQMRTLAVQTSQNRKDMRKLIRNTDAYIGCADVTEQKGYAEVDT